MKRVLDVLKSESGAFCFFDEVFLFGSSLWAEAPRDIDLLLVYGKASPQQANAERERIEEVLARRLPDCDLDFVTLSKSELLQTDFLVRVRHRRIVAD